MFCAQAKAKAKTNTNAKRTAAAVKKGAHTQQKKKIWSKVTFKLPKTLATRRKPIAQPRSVQKYSTWDKHSIIRQPLNSDAAVKNIEDHNTLVFIVDKRANKHVIRKACQDLYSIQVRKVNTLIRPDGQKKAYVVLNKQHDALEIANKIGIM